MLKVTSNTARVTDATMVRKIVNEFAYRDCEFNICDDKGEATLELEGEGLFFPLACRETHLPDEKQFPDNESWDQACDDMLYEKGETSFDDLLVELASFLQTPLIILVAELSEFVAYAFTFIINPGSTTVEKLDAKVSSEDI